MSIHYTAPPPPSHHHHPAAQSATPLLPPPPSCPVCRSHFSHHVCQCWLDGMMASEPLSRLPFDIVCVHWHSMSGTLDDGGSVLRDCSFVWTTFFLWNPAFILFPGIGPLDKNPHPQPHPTTPACKVFGLKSVHVCLRIMYFAVLYQMCFQYGIFWWKSFHVLVQKRKGMRVSNFGLLLVLFKWHHGSERLPLQCVVILLSSFSVCLVGWLVLFFVAIFCFSFSMSTFHTQRFRFTKSFFPVFFFCEWILLIYLFHLLPWPRKWTVSENILQLQKMRFIEGQLNEKQNRGTLIAFCTLVWKAWVWKDLKIREFCWKQ